MSKYEDLREQTESADGEQLSRLGALVWKAYEADEITNVQLHQLDDVWQRRITELGGVRPVSAYEELSDTIRSAHDEATLRRPGQAAFRAHELGQITEDELHLLVRQGVRRAAELGIPLEVVSAPAATPEVIPLANLHRLDLKPGDKLAVIAPEWVDAEAKLQRFAAMVQQHLAEYADIQAIVFPPGTKLDVVSADRAES